MKFTDVINSDSIFVNDINLILQEIGNIGTKGRIGPKGRTGQKCTNDYIRYIGEQVDLLNRMKLSTKS